MGMDREQAKRILVEMREKYRLMRDASDRFGEVALYNGYKRQVDALDIAISALGGRCGDN